MTRTIEAGDLDRVFHNLLDEGYQVVGPRVREGAIVYDKIARADDLPVGWTDEQEAGTYRLKRREDGAFFGYNVGPHSWKQFLHPPARRLATAQRTGNHFKMVAEEESIPRYAFVGVRSCELHAIAIQDRVFIREQEGDSSYQQRREKAFLLAVNCGQAGKTCFCASMQTGPKVKSEFDLALTEILDPERHYFVVEVGSARGEKALKGTSCRLATHNDVAAAEAVVECAEKQMGRTLNTEGIKELLYQNSEHPRWDEVAERCLTCANCTMACPTCFCSTIEDVTDLKGDHAERWQKWDSCFTLDFSYLNGTGSVRHSTRSRYRQWMTHKLASWQDQFGSSGCVGCGRCITWCPVGIDLTEEVTAMRGEEL